jgi:hypothetical protein
MRQLSDTCFALALASALWMKSVAIQDAWVWLAVISVLVSALLTHLVIPRIAGLGGLGGLCLVFLHLGTSSVAGIILITLTALLVSTAVLLAAWPEIFGSQKGNANLNEN